MQTMRSSTLAVQCRVPLAMLRLWLLLCMLLSAAQYPRAVKGADDVSPCELESIINQLANPNPEYQLHASALRSQLRQLLRERQRAASEDQALNNDYDYLDEDKRSVAALAAQGLLHPKRSLATLAKNGQLPSSTEPEDTEPATPNEEKRYVGSLARSGGGGFLGYGKRNIGSLARDFQLPQNGKRNLATLARLGLLSNKADTNKRNLAAVARYNSRMATVSPTEKRNLGALKGSPVHGGFQQKRSEDDEVLLPASIVNGAMDYADYVPSYWLYPSYADMDWGDFGRAQKRFLDTSKDPELFGIENALPLPDAEPLLDADDTNDANDNDDDEDEEDNAHAPLLLAPQKRHIGAVYRSGFLPSYRALRSTTGTYGGAGGGGGGGGRFSRSGRARQFVEYYPQRERLRQPIAAVCKRCFLPYRPVVHWGAAAGIRGRLPKYAEEDETPATASILTNSLPITSGRRPIAYASTSRPSVRNGARTRTVSHSWGTPPRITALHRRSFRRPDTDSMENYAY